MLRAAAQSSSLLRRLPAATSIVNKLSSPLVTTDLTATPYSRSGVACYSNEASLLLFPSFLGQIRGYARAPPKYAGDSDLSDFDKDSEDFDSDEVDGDLPLDSDSELPMDVDVEEDEDDEE